VPEDEWTGTSVQAVMLPRDRVYWTTPDETALALMERMRHDNLHEVAVIDSDAWWDWLRSIRWRRPCRSARI